MVSFMLLIQGFYLLIPISILLMIYTKIKRGYFFANAFLMVYFFALLLGGVFAILYEDLMQINDASFNTILVYLLETVFCLVYILLQFAFLHDEKK